ncbi:MAG: POT family MFS transporter [Deltaproteobacteria bacterium]|nr:POT family MFS transporter [Deltaproteobacteria bacterium]
MGEVGATSKVGFPSQIKYIVGNEACERFSFYGMRSILVIYMIQYLSMAQSDAKSVYHLFVSANYFLPLLGAYLADRYWGKYRTIMRLSMVYCLGHAAIAFYDSKYGLFLGLSLIALGAGGIKPCVSANVGDQFSKANEHLLKKVFDWFYFSVNFGAFFSSLLIPWMLPKFGPSWAFGIPGILMAIATYVFWWGRRQYVMVPPSGSANSTEFFPIVAYSVVNLGKREKGRNWLDVAKMKFGVEKVENVKAALSILKVFLVVSIFWALFDQQGSTWTLQAKQMNLDLWGMKLEASQIQSLNPILVLMLIPIFSGWLYPWIERKGISVTPLRKMATGMALAGFSFVFVAVCQIALDHGYQISVAWQTIPYVIITASEIMISITGLEFAYTQAPKPMKSTLQSFWLLTIALGNFLTAFISHLNRFQGAFEFFFYATLMFAVTGIFIRVAMKYQVRDYVETTFGAPEPAPAT